MKETTSRESSKREITKLEIKTNKLVATFTDNTVARYKYKTNSNRTITLPEFKQTFQDMSEVFSHIEKVNN